MFCTKYWFIFLFLFCVGCTQYQDNDAKNDQNDVINLNTSTNIILELIKSNQLVKVLQADATPEGIELLIKNTSPAQMALEIEAINRSKEQPVVLVFYNEKSDKNAIVKQEIKILAECYKDEVTFIQIDVQKLYSIAQQSKIDTYPALLVIHNRIEVYRIEDLENNDMAMNQLQIILAEWIK